jgi:hypothetical protein
MEKDDMKKKLDSIWNEVQTSLPEIDFESDFKTDDFELVGDRNNDFDFENLEDFSEINGNEPNWSHFEKLLCKDQQLEAVAKSMVNIQLDDDSFDGRDASAGIADLDEFKTFQSSINSSATRECITSAQAITKHIFGDSGVSKLNMDLFNTINFGKFYFYILFMTNHRLFVHSL